MRFSVLIEFFFSVFWFVVIFFYDFASDKSTLEVEILLLLGSTFEFNSHQYGSAPKRVECDMQYLQRSRAIFVPSRILLDCVKAKNIPIRW